MWGGGEQQRSEPWRTARGHPPAQQPKPELGASRPRVAAAGGQAGARAGGRLAGQLPLRWGRGSTVGSGRGWPTSWRERRRRGRSLRPDLQGCSPPLPLRPRCTRQTWPCRGSRGTAPASGGRRRCAAAGAAARARSPAGAAAGSGPAPRAPAACARPRRAAGAARPPGGCNTLPPVASAGGTDKSKGQAEVRGTTAPRPPARGRERGAPSPRRRTDAAPTGHAGADTAGGAAKRPSRGPVSAPTALQRAGTHGAGAGGRPLGHLPLASRGGTAHPATAQAATSLPRPPGVSVLFLVGYPLTWYCCVYRQS